jgi:predicted component of type VI protein secretion system
MAAPSALLEVVAGKAAGMSIVVDDELVVGRNAEGAGKLAEDGELSRSHARIAIDGNGFCAVEDLGSTNGTFVNGLRITTPQTLSQGDTIEVGGTTLVVRDLPAVGRQITAPSAVASLPIPPASAGPLPPAEPAPSEPAPLAEPVPPAEPAADVAPPAEPVGSDTESETAVAASAAGSLSLQLEVDFSAREARLRLNHADEPLRLVCEDGLWRVAPAEAATDVRDSA